MRRATSHREHVLELRHLRYFLAVAKHRNFTRAAEELGTAQPSLSQQIRQLEAEIGAELFSREKRQIALTPAGTVFLSEARGIAAMLEAAVVHAREADRGMRGELRVGYTSSALMTTLPSAIRAFRAAHEHVRIVLRASMPIDMVEGLRGGDLDVAVFLTSPNLAPAPALEMRRIASLPIGAVLPQRHPLAGRRSFALQELASETFLLYGRRQSDIFDHVLALCRAAGFAPARVEEADRVETIVGLVAAGEGVSIVPLAYDVLKLEGVVYRALSPAPEPFDLNVAIRADARSPLIEAFVETCVSAAGGVARA